jgi:hypothetical protein
VDIEIDRNIDIQELHREAPRVSAVNSCRIVATPQKQTSALASWIMKPGNIPHP